MFKGGLGELFVWNKGDWSWILRKAEEVEGRRGKAREEGERSTVPLESRQEERMSKTKGSKDSQKQKTMYNSLKRRSKYPLYQKGLD